MQLGELGFSGSAVDRWIRSGRLHRVHRGVYAVGHTALSEEGRWMAAVLAAGPGALLSHRAAANLWGIVRKRSRVIDVTTSGAQRRVPGVAVHRTRRLRENDAARRHGIPVTSVARTLVDFAEHATRGELERALHQAELSHTLTRQELSAAAIPGRKHANAVTRQQPDATRSDLERRFLKLCDDHGIERPHTNATVEGHEVDATWRRERIAVELDGWAVHRTRRAFEHDRARDQRLTLAGWQVIRITHRHVTEEPWRVAATVRAALASRR